MALLSDKQFLGVAVVGFAGGWYLYSKGKVALNPLNKDNLVNSALTSALGGGDRDAGQMKVAATLDPLFARVDLLNPFVSDARKQFARDLLAAQ